MYFAADRPDIAYAVKDVAKQLAEPKQENLQKITRVARCLLNPDFNRTAQVFLFIAAPAEVMLTATPNGRVVKRPARALLAASSEAHVRDHQALIVHAEGGCCVLGPSRVVCAQPGRGRGTR